MTEETTGWQNVDNRLTRVIVVQSFEDAVSMIRTIERTAEARNHHPDVTLSWRPPPPRPNGETGPRRPPVVALRLVCFTHTTGLVEDADVELSRAIDDAVRNEP